MTDDTKPFVRTLCVDFDGVIHSYVSGWQGVGVADDPPVPGAIGWLKTMLIPPASDKYRIAIYSSRSKQPQGIMAMIHYLQKHGLAEQELDKIDFPTQKPPAYLTIDDRAFCFKGQFPKIEYLDNFKPWYKKSSQENPPIDIERAIAILEETPSAIHMAESSLDQARSTVIQVIDVLNGEKC